MKNTTQGFTLIELLIVIAIIGILAAVLIPNLLGAQKRAYDTAAQSCAKSLQTAQATYQIDKQLYFSASKAEDATAVTTTPATGIDGISAGCSQAKIVIATVGTPDAASYTMTVRDTRGTKTYTVTPSALTGS
ncbi:type II secretion system protein [Deinococcus arcticus]|uniref:Type II secretion system protein n=1 Tax=Deinococcus arcticus TaxID=2136176 RepID=A0A2T3W3T8_9DEIO|nr:type II secretion system protein [Deinococcus arcticus]PTA66568.1 type II secretion system protein [Deinococcus arcticus]